MSWVSFYLVLSGHQTPMPTSGRTGGALALGSQGLSSVLYSQDFSVFAELMAHRVELSAHLEALWGIFLFILCHFRTHTLI